MKNFKKTINIHDSPVCIRTFLIRHEAMIAQGLLASHKIASYISADDAGGAYPFPVANRMGVELLVKSSDVITAKKLLKTI